MDARQCGGGCLAGLALRAFFVFGFPASGSGDAPFYIELAWNWLKNAVYGVYADGRLIPLDARVPGYPAFLAAIFSIAGKSPHAVLLVQTVVDLATCFLIALIAARLAPASSRRRVALAGLWLAALCPFTANYTAVVQTETLITFLTALAILQFVGACGRGSSVASSSAPRGFEPVVSRRRGCRVRRAGPPRNAIAARCHWTGAAGEMVAASELGQACARGRADGRGTCVLPLLPWAARNWRSLHEVQFLTARYLQMPDDFSPRGFDDWTATWLWKFGDVYRTLWQLNSAEIPIDSIPAQAFDSPAERARVAAILESYNYTLTETRAGRRIRRNRARAHRPASAAHIRENSAAAVAGDVVHAADGVAAKQQPSAARRD